MSLEEGKVILRWPDNLSKESVGDLKTWLEFIVRRLERPKPPIESEHPTSAGEADRVRRCKRPAR